MIFLNALLFAASAPVAAHASGPQDLTKRVTYTTVAIPIGKALADLAQLSGVSVRASAPIAGEPVILRLDDVPIGDTLQKIAATFDAEWVKSENVLVLERPAALVRQTEQKEIAVRTKEFADQLAAKRKSLAALPAWDASIANKLANQLSDIAKQEDPQHWNQQTWQRRQAITEKLPSHRALMRMLTLLDPADIARVPSGDRIVFSTNPTAMQRPLGREIAAVLSQFAADMAVWAEERSRVMPGDLSQRGMYFNDDSDGSVTAVAPTVVLVTVDNNGYFGAGANIDMKIGDAKGMIVGRANEMLGGLDYSEAMGKPADKSIDEPVLTISPDSETMLNAFKQGFSPPSGGKAKPLDPAAIKMLVNPEKRDPLSFGTSDLMIETSKFKKLNLVAAPTDFMISLGMDPGTADKPKPTAVLRTLNVFGAATTEAGWLTFKPRNAAFWRSRMVDRSVLGRYLRAIAAQGDATLDDKALYAAGTKGEEYESVGSQLGMLLMSSRPSYGYDESNWDALRLYGMMSSTQRSQLLAGQKMPLAYFDPPQLEVISRMVYNSNQMLNLDQSGVQALGLKDFERTFYNGLNQEPTICLPNGVPRDAYLVGTTSTNTVAATSTRQSGNMYYGGQEMTPDQLAWQLFAQTRTDLFPWMSDPNNQQSIDRLHFGTVTTIALRFQYSALVVHNAQLRESKLDANKTLTYSQLPDDFRKRVDVAVENLKKQYKDAKPGQYTAPPPQGNNIPPHRQ